ncbi:MAG: hypothetical protein KC964_14760, partial [Candidatus Omnitrophica bacterium]|nr:hypothetical protein [Candidatus Omnitrophota bacterium]
IVSTTVESSSTSIRLGGLASGVDYMLRLLAINGNGESDPAVLPFTTRFDRTRTPSREALERLSLDWSPAKASVETVEEGVPSPVDINLDGWVNAEDLVLILDDLNRGD